MLALKRLAHTLGMRLVLALKKWRIQRRSRRWGAKTFQQKAQLIAMYLLGSIIFGWILWHSPFRGTTVLALVRHPPSFVQVGLPEANGGGKGAGGVATHPLNPSLVADVCDPLDPTCFANSIASWAASGLESAFSPLTNGILTNPADIIYQTPATDSYGNSVVMAFNKAFVGVLDAALACLLVIGAYNLIWGHHLRAPHTSITELIPRAVLVVGAVHFDLLFLGMFIDFANDLSLMVVHLASYHMLTDIIESLLTGKTLEGLLVVVLVIVLGIMVVCLLIQRVGTIALIALLVIVAPLGLSCFLLPQTMRWGRLWFSTLSSALVTQVLQVTALGLGGAFITTVGTTSLLHLDQGLANAFLAIGTMFLVLKIPGMLQTWALQPASDHSRENAGESSSSGQGDSSATTSSTDTSSFTASDSSLTSSDAVSATSFGGGGATTAVAGGGAGGAETVAAAAALL